MLTFIYFVILIHINLYESTEINKVFSYCEQTSNKFETWNLNKDNKQKAEDIDLDQFYENPENASEIIYKSKFGVLYQTKCFFVNKINIYNNVDKCFKDILINFKINNTTKDAFLTKFGILRKKSVRKNCDSESTNIKIKDIELIKYENLVIVKENNGEALQLKRKKQNLIENIIENQIDKINTITENKTISDEYKYFVFLLIFFFF